MLALQIDITDKGEGKNEALSHADISERMGEDVTEQGGKYEERVGVKFGGKFDFSPDDECIVI